MKDFKKFVSVSVIHLVKKRSFCDKRRGSIPFLSFSLSLSLSSYSKRVIFTLHPREQKIPSKKNIELYTLKIHFVKCRETERRLKNLVYLDKNSESEVKARYKHQTLRPSGITK